MSRKITRILISTMPRSGTVYFFDFISKLFHYKKVDVVFTAGVPEPPEWDPYRLDQTYLSLKESEVLCAHYPLSEKLLRFMCQDDLLCLYLYRDPRDVAVSAVLYIKHVLTHHALHDFFQRISEEEAITFILTGGVIKTNSGEKYVIHEGMRYFCDTAQQWLAQERVVALRYEDLMPNPVATLFKAFDGVGIFIETEHIHRIAAELNFSDLAGGRVPGQEQKSSHYRKGIQGDHVNYFTETHKAISKLIFGNFLIAQGYEADLLW